jgi:hypothetical protein
VEAAELAKHQWVCIAANQRMGQYDILASQHPIDPVWPELPLEDLLRRAFRDLLIDTWNHDILCSLRP